MDLDEAAERLYGVAPAEFVAVRAELRRRARESGDAAVARAIADLRKPTVAAWAVNQVARDHPEELSELLDVGERLRRAWRDQDAAALTQLTARRSEATGSLSRLVKRTAEQRGQALSVAALNEVEQTLDAALVDADAADQVRRGRLVRALSYSGFAPAQVTAAGPKSASKTREKAGAAADTRTETAEGEGARPEPLAAANSGKAEKPATKAEARARAAAEAEERRAAEREGRRRVRQEAAETAARAAAEAERDHAEWRARLDRAEQEYRRQAELVTDLESRLSAARERLRDAERRLGVIRRDEGKARREAATLRRRADQAHRALKE